uniref:Uncharacterized protein n=1 Tax=Wuchereria bancrofti TaxID=6293 RepID=A0A1I8E8N4_WUCBA
MLISLKVLSSSPISRAHFDVTSALVMICVGAVIVCAVALMFPTERLDVSTMIPDWLHISVHLKLVFAYISGLITLVLLRPAINYRDVVVEQIISDENLLLKIPQNIHF